MTFQSKKEVLWPCMFSYMIMRIINWTVAAIYKYPNKRVLASKVGYKSACHQLRLSWRTALQTCAQLPEDELALLFLRLTFGDSPGPYEWRVVSESICDLANAILLHDNWDPEMLHDPEKVFFKIKKENKKQFHLLKGKN
eukprot:3652543-Ditylum_brightwellii.AAC.1